MKLSEYLKNKDTELVELTEEQVSKLNEMFEKELYFIDIDGSIEKDNFMLKHSFYQRMFELGNAFLTKEEAIFELEKQKLLVELKRFADDNNDEIDWENNFTLKYVIVYNHLNTKLETTSVLFAQDINNIYFSSKEIAQEAIEKFGEEIIKYCYRK